jgi:hypothetical protein
MRGGRTGVRLELAVDDVVADVDPAEEGVEAAAGRVRARVGGGGRGVRDAFDAGRGVV